MPGDAELRWNSRTGFYEPQRGISVEDEFKETRKALDAETFTPNTIPSSVTSQVTPLYTYEDQQRDEAKNRALEDEMNRQAAEYEPDDEELAWLAGQGEVTE